MLQAAIHFIPRSSGFRRQIQFIVLGTAAGRFTRLGRPGNPIFAADPSFISCVTEYSTTRPLRLIARVAAATIEPFALLVQILHCSGRAVFSFLLVFVDVMLTGVGDLRGCFLRCRRQ